MRVINNLVCCGFCGMISPGHHPWCSGPGRASSRITCTVCGLKDGDHAKECIDSLIRANTFTLSKLVNRCYNEILNIKKAKIVNWLELDALCEHIARETGMLRSLNETVTAESRDEAPPEDTGEGCS